MLTGNDAELMALRQSVKLSRARLENVVDKLEDMTAQLVLPSQLATRDMITDVILNLKYILDFTLGEPKP